MEKGVFGGWRAGAGGWWELGARCWGAGGLWAAGGWWGLWGEGVGLVLGARRLRGRRLGTAGGMSGDWR